MMRFTYEEDGITVSMETDATGLYEDYSHGDGVLGHFLRFLRAAGYSFEIEEMLQVMDPNKEVIIDQSELRRRTDGYHVQWSDEDVAWVAESSGVTAYSDKGPIDALALLRGPEKQEAFDAEEDV